MRIPFGAPSALVMLTFFAGVAAGPHRGAVEFGYTAAGGRVPPVDWGDLSATCRNGERQSPIAISGLEVLSTAGATAPEIRYGTSDLRVFNNGHTIEAEVEEGAGEIEIDGTAFELLQFHIHYGSEHMIDGELFYAEIHLVHRDAAGNLAVLASLLQRGERNTKLNPYFRAARRLPATADQQEVADFDLEQLVPEGDPGYYHYSGSLTTPPCSEGVSWWVFDTWRTISRAQLDDIKVGVPAKDNPQGNRRPVQGRNGRPIYRMAGQG